MLPLPITMSAGRLVSRQAPNTQPTMAHTCKFFLKNRSIHSRPSRIVQGRRGYSTTPRASPADVEQAAVSTSADSATDEELYKRLVDELRSVNSLSACMSVLTWDELVMMPDGAAEARGAQKAALAEAIHARRTAPQVGELINSVAARVGLVPGAEASGSGGLSEYAVANVRDALREYEQESRKPAALAKKEAELSSQGYHTWVKARGASDWGAYTAVLRELVGLRADIAAAWDPAMPPYDVCIDRFERGLSQTRIDEILTEVKSGLVPLIRRVAAAPQLDPHPALAEGRFDTAAQEALCREVAAAMGFDFGCGRMDASVHPFTGGSHPTDTRITTRYSEDSFLEALYGTIHEVGHALYEQGRNAEHSNLPVSQALSMGVHESQSLFWERMVAQSLPFCEWLLPLLHKHFPHTAECTAQDLYRYINQVQGSLIRVDADELTYPLHIVLRFEIERALFDGSLKVEDIPEAWNSKMQEYLGVTPGSDAEGALQDVHWSDGAFGYFPSYTLGAVFASQFHACAAAQLPGLDDQIRAGHFHPLRDWLKTHIHQVGSLHPSAEELCMAVTGSGIQPTLFVEYLTKKYTALYDL